MPGAGVKQLGWGQKQKRPSPTARGHRRIGSQSREGKEEPKLQNTEEQQQGPQGKQEVCWGAKVGGTNQKLVCLHMDQKNQFVEQKGRGKVPASAADLDDFGFNLLLLLCSVKDDLLNGACTDQHKHQHLLLLPNAVRPILCLQPPSTLPEFGRNPRHVPGRQH